MATYVSKYRKLRILKTPPESAVTVNGVVTTKSAQWIDFDHGFYETNDQDELALLEKCPHCKPLEDCEVLMQGDQKSKTVITEDYAVPWKKAVQLLGGEEKVLKKLVSLGNIKPIETDKGKRYKIDEINACLTAGLV